MWGHEAKNQIWDNGLVPNWEKEYVKAVYYHPVYLTYIQSTSCEIPDWIKHKLESILLEEISITSYADDTTLMA